MDLRKAYLDMRRAGEDHFPPACLDYVYRLVFRLSEPNGFAPAKGSVGPMAPAARFRQLAPSRLCEALRRQALADFGELAGEVMRRWGLVSGADLGAAVFLLARHRCLSLGEGETLEEYAAAGAFQFH